MRRSRELLQLRIAAHRFSPGPALDGDGLIRLLGDALRAPAHPGPEPLRVRVLISVWCVVTLVAPTALVPWLVRKRYGRGGAAAGNPAATASVGPARR